MILKGGDDVVVDDNSVLIVEEELEEREEREWKEKENVRKSDLNVKTCWIKMNRVREWEDDSDENKIEQLNNIENGKRRK